jgi:uncharacterized protein (TIGR02147 family)
MNELMDYRTILKTTFAERRRTNPLYSLRAFARDLELSPGRLSKILNNKQGLSLAMAENIAGRLGLSVGETEVFSHLVNASDARSRVERAKAQVQLVKKFQEGLTVLEDDEFKLISDWYHFALVDLIETEGFKNDTKWIAKRLGISPVEVETALERLMRLGVLKKKDKRIVWTGKDVTTSRDIPSQSIREFHRQIITKALRALSEQSVHERDFSAITFSFDSKLVAQFQTKIEKLRREIYRAQKESGTSLRSKKNEVYCLSVQFFRLSEKES